MFNKFINFLTKITFLNFLNKKFKKKIYFLLLWIFSFPERIFFPIIFLYKSFFKTGLFHSWIHQEPLDQSKKKIPWITDSAFYYLSQLNLKEYNIFEFGAGNSTIWFLDKFKKVYSVESDKEYKEYLLNIIKKNNHHSSSKYEIFYESDKDRFNNYLDNFKTEFDVIMIDGAFDRKDCCNSVIQYVKKFPCKIIILDNTEVFGDTALKIESELNYFRVDFFGNSANNLDKSVTSFFFNKNYIAAKNYRHI